MIMPCPILEVIDVCPLDELAAILASLLEGNIDEYV